MRSSGLAAAALVLATALLSFGAAANEEAEAELARGVAHYEAGEHEAAAAAFEHAYELDPKPIYLFSWAQSEVGRDRCPEAVDIFRRYLETQPPEANQEAAEARIRFCEERLANAPAPVPVPTASASAPPPAPTQTAPPTPLAPAPTQAATAAPLAPTRTSTPPAPVERDAPATWWTDPLTLTLLGGGLVASGVGAGVFLWGQGNLADAREQAFEDYQAHQRALEVGRTRRIAGGVTVGAGLALIGGSVIRAIVVGDGSPDQEPGPEASTHVDVWLDTGALGLGELGLSARGRF